MESVTVTALAHKKDQCCLELETDANQAMGVVLRWLWEQGETPPLFQQGLAANGSQTLLLVLSCPLVAGVLVALRAVDAQLRVLREQRPLAVITIIGAGFWQSPETVANISGVFSESPILMDSRNTAVTVCVPESTLEDALNALHAKLF